MLPKRQRTGALQNLADLGHPQVMVSSAITTDDAPVILIQGAREHNLKDLTLTIPRNAMVVITGVSGSGKSTVAFDLLFAEGQRRFLDCMNAYARQFVDQLPRPDVDLIAGIPPTVSIEQRSTRGGGKSTVATVTEIFHFLRLMFARLGTLYCPRCQIRVEAQTPDELRRQLEAELKPRGDLLLLAPVVRNRKGYHTDVAEWAAQQGFAEVRADGKIHSTQERLRLDRFREHDVEIVVGVLDRKDRTGAGAPRRDKIDTALKIGHGTLLALDNHGRVTVHSTERSCRQCGQSFEILDPKMFSFNSPRGWCPTCRGFGELFYLPKVDRGARAEDIEESWYDWMEGQREICPECQGTRLNPLARAVRLEIAPWRGKPASPPPPRPPGRKSGSPIADYPTLVTFADVPVSDARAFFQRLKLHGRAAIIARDILPEIRERLKFLERVGLGYLELGRGITTLSGGETQRIRLAAQLGSNLSGVLYILDEPTIGLHARDNQRLLKALAELRARGNSLVIVEHDEATMRAADHIIDLGPGAGVNGGRLVASGTLRQLLRHPESITGRCLLDKHSFPSRGRRRPVLPGTEKWPGPGGTDALLKASPRARSAVLAIHGATRHNLVDVDVAFPLGRFVVVTGVSGSGKSTLVRECLLPALRSALAAIGSGPHRRKPNRKTVEPVQNIDSPDRARPAVLTGHESIRAVYEVDQLPIGRTPRSIPATYVGFFDEVRQLFSQVPEARLRGYSPSRFSFNSAQGRCPACDGAGVIKMEMSFLPPAFVRCETCAGTRFNQETLDILWNGKNIAAVLEMTVAEALDFFAAMPRIRRPLEALRDTGLDYLKLGQTSPTLSGGEAQRLKLVTHLLAGFRGPKPGIRGQKSEVGSQASRIRGQKSEDDAAPADLVSELRSPASGSPGCLFLLEEPTIGLHIADVRRLVEVLQRLVDAGHSVIVIEHNLDLIAEADWLIDLGPEGGGQGGRIVATGTPEQIARAVKSHTGQFLRPFLAGKRTEH